MVKLGGPEMMKMLIKPVEFLKIHESRLLQSDILIFKKMSNKFNRVFDKKRLFFWKWESKKLKSIVIFRDKIVAWT